MARKTYVAVYSKTDECGLITPIFLIFKGQRMEIDRVTERRQAHATKTGGQGTRYTIYISGKQTYLFEDNAKRWFVEENDNVRQIPYHH